MQSSSHELSTPVGDKHIYIKNLFTYAEMMIS